jgi:deoxyribodipyrimidine photo-lyase
MKIIIFNHRRDLRIEDNIGLYKCLSHSNDSIVIPSVGTNEQHHTNERSLVVPVFFFDPKQIILNNHNKHYFSAKSAYFIIHSVIDLINQYKKIGSKLLVLYDEPKKCLELIIKTILKNYNDPEIIFGYNKDYSKYSVERDMSLNDIAKKYNIMLINDDEHSDYCLIPWNNMLKDPINKIAYKQYGAFYKNAKKYKVSEPLKYNKLYKKFISSKIYTKLFQSIEFTDFDSLIDDSIITDINNISDLSLSTPDLKLSTSDQWLNAGRQNCLNRLKVKQINHLKKYNTSRDILSYETSNISAYLNIGSVSVREICKLFYKKLSKNTQLINQLYWRDFYLSALRFLPDGNEYHHMDKRYDNIKWITSLNSNDKKYKLMIEYWNKMMNSKTGFLLIDAGMSQLIKTGFLHGRLRMILGTFWTKYLLINIFDPKYGSQVGYSKLLVDAIGPSQNKLNHQWITEFDMPGKKYSAPNAPLSGRPMNISNIQIKKFDKDCLYIKKWLNHLSDVPNKDLYNWSEDIATKYNNIHPAPIFNHSLKYKEWIKICTI